MAPVTTEAWWRNLSRYLCGSNCKRHIRLPSALPLTWPNETGGIVLTPHLDHPDISRHFPSKRLPGYEHLLLRSSYLSSISYRTKIPNWVSEKVTPAGIDSEMGRSAFVEDTDVPMRWRCRNGDYFLSNYSKGHMAAAGLHKDSEAGSKHTFLLSGNILPQDQGNNGSDWYRLENLSRRFAKCCDDVYVVSGPMWLPKDMTLAELKEWKTPNTQDLPNEANVQNNPRKVEYDVIGRNQISAPTHLWKVIVAAGCNKENHIKRNTKPWEKLDFDAMSKMGKCAVSAFIMPNKPEDVQKHLTEFEVSLECIEGLAGIDLEGLVQYCEEKTSRQTEKSSDDVTAASVRRAWLRQISLCGPDGIRCNDDYDSRIHAARLQGVLATADTVEKLEQTWSEVVNNKMDSDSFLQKAYNGRKTVLKTASPGELPRATYFPANNVSTPVKQAMSSSVVKLDEKEKAIKEDRNTAKAA